MKPLLELEQVTKCYGQFRAADQVSLALFPGQAMALWGPNGAGKSTLVRCILGLFPYQGRITVAGHPPGKRALASLGYVPQEVALHDDLTVAQSMGFYARLKRADLTSIGRALAQVGLAEVTQRTVRALSGGMRQRLALAMALLGDPPLLLLDEPTSNLDLGGREDFLKLLLELKHQGKALLFSSHRSEEVAELADRVAVLERGRLVRECAPHEVGGHTSMRLRLAPASVDPARALLLGHGFPASRADGVGLWVTVPADAKAGPLQTLQQAGIAVLDFDLG